MEKQLEDLAIEIYELQQQLELAKRYNKREQVKYALEKTKASLKRASALFAAPVIGTTIATLAGWNLFKYNSEKQYAYTTTTIDKDGNLTEDKKYEGDFEKFFPSQSNVNYYTQWVKTEDDKYEREKYSYSVSEKDMDKVLELTKTDGVLTEARINQLFPNCNGVETEERVELTSEELSSPSYIDAMFVQKDKNDYIVAKESDSSHMKKLLLKMLIEICAILIEIEFLEEHTRFFEKIAEAEDKAQPRLRDTVKIKKKLQQKQFLLGVLPNNSQKDR